MSEALGYAASSAVLASFLMRSMVPLRLIALFILGVMAASLGIRAAIHIALAFFSSKQELIHAHFIAPRIFD